MISGYKHAWTKLFLLSAFAAGLFCANIIAAHPAYAKTACAAVVGITPQKAPAKECATPPCAPNAVGPLTQCLLDGEDPPITDPQWDESKQGVIIMGGSMISGKCGPAYFKQPSPLDPMVPGYNKCGNPTNNPCKPILNCPIDPSMATIGTTTTIYDNSFAIITPMDSTVPIPPIVPLIPY